MSARPKIFLSVAAIAALLTVLVAFAMPAKPEASPTPQPSPAPQAAATPKKHSDSTADHSKFKELQKNFKTGPEVTEACLICHTEAAKQVQHTKHWTWESKDPKTGQVRGKKNIINNYCTAVLSNEKD
ncbi:MAG: hypothetical protein AAB278_08765 [Pseudomonadota bacterium]